jgi:hypothetical protein
MILNNFCSCYVIVSIKLHAYSERKCALENCQYCGEPCSRLILLITSRHESYRKHLAQQSKSKSHYDRPTDTVLEPGANLRPETNFSFSLRFFLDSYGLLCCSVLLDERTGTVHIFFIIRLSSRPRREHQCSVSLYGNYLATAIVHRIVT